MSSTAEAGRSIARSIFALVIGSVLAATAISFAITFSGPPPKDPPIAIDAVAAALTSGPRRGTPPLRVTATRQAPTPRSGQAVNTNAARSLAATLDVPIDNVVALTAEQPRGIAGGYVGDFAFARRDGAGWRTVRPPASPFFKRWHWITLGSMLATILLLAIPTWSLASAITQPLRRLADAADQARAGAELPPLCESGSREVRDLTRAVTTMHARIAGHAEGRTAMLAAIAHDLGTPLSRIAFWIEGLPEPARARAAADIDEMRAMICSALAFARDEIGERSRVRIDLGSLLDSLVEDLSATGVPVTIESGSRAIVGGDPGALRRLFANLIDNAVRYGDRAAIGWHVGEAQVDVTIDDAGPGIDPATVERLFEPFVRGDPSRNRATGGTGLGLAIVRSIAVRHGGAVTLEQAASGARARVTLPVSA